MDPAEFRAKERVKVERGPMRGPQRPKAAQGPEEGRASRARMPANRPGRMPERHDVMLPRGARRSRSPPIRGMP